MVLEELLKGGTVSGQFLAERFSVSRNSIWKAINGLRAQGYDITGTTNSGYVFSGDGNIVSAALIKGFLKEPDKYCIHVFKELVSTNNTAKEMASSGCPDNTVIVADSQAGGRGRAGKSFFSPGSSGIYFTLLVRPKMDPVDSRRLTTYAAVITARAIERLSGGNVKIKWVNDLFMNGRKICGILTEAGLDFESGTLDYAVIGTGVNVRHCDFPDGLSAIATTVEDETGKKISRSAVVSEFLNEFNISDILRPALYMDEYRRRSNVIGKTAHVAAGDTEYSGIVSDIDDEAELVIDCCGEKRLVNSGVVRFDM